MAVFGTSDGVMMAVFGTSDGGYDGNFWYIRWLNWNLMIGTDQIQLREDGCSVQGSGKVLNIRNWVPVKDCGII